MNIDKYGRSKQKSYNGIIVLKKCIFLKGFIFTIKIFK